MPSQTWSPVLSPESVETPSAERTCAPVAAATFKPFPASTPLMSVSVAVDTRFGPGAPLEPAGPCAPMSDTGPVPDHVPVAFGP